MSCGWARVGCAVRWICRWSDYKRGAVARAVNVVRLTCGVSEPAALFEVLNRVVLTTKDDVWQSGLLLVDCVMRHATRQDIRHATRQDMQRRGTLGHLISRCRILVRPTRSPPLEWQLSAALPNIGRLFIFQRSCQSLSTTRSWASGTQIRCPSVTSSFFTT